MNQMQPELTSPLQVGVAPIGDEIDLLQYWNIVWREKWGIIGLIVTVLLLTMVIVNNMTPIYSAEATLLIEAKEANVVSIEEVYGIDSSRREYFSTQFEILNSRQLAEEVVRQFKLDRHPGLDPRLQRPLFDWRRYIPFLPTPKPLSEAQIWHSVVAKFQANVSITPVRNTQLVKITFESAYPELARKVANAIGNAYIDNNLESRLALTQKAADWLVGRLSGMRKDLESAERSLQSFREREKLVDV